jgi:hypothetical protein
VPAGVFGLPGAGWVLAMTNAAPNEIKLLLRGYLRMEEPEELLIGVMG